jgi:hypothetical protein
LDRRFYYCFIKTAGGFVGWFIYGGFILNLAAVQRDA